MLATLACAGSAEAAAHRFTAQIDVRAVAVDSPLASFAHGGLGLLRYDEDHARLRLGNLMANLAGPLGETVRYDVTGFATGDGDQNPFDLTEAYLEWRPIPASRWRWRGKLGAFYPAISLENRAAGWQSLYSISPSALNTWIGEEIRTIGGEVSATLVGASAGRNVDVSFIGAAFGWNDPMGVLIFQRGWAIHDRQSALFGRLPRPFQSDRDGHNIEFFREIDGRAGYYVGAELKWAHDNVVRVMHYDNRGDPAQGDGQEQAWRSRFDALGARMEWDNGWTAVVQGMLGDTGVGRSADGRGLIITEYWAWFALGSYSRGQHRYTARYDVLYTEPTRGAQYFSSEQDAHAWTLAYTFNLDAHWQFAAEALQVRGSLEQRELQGLPAQATENMLQLAARFTF